MAFGPSLLPLAILLGLSQAHSSSDLCARPTLGLPDSHGRIDCPRVLDESLAGPDPRGWGPWTHRPYCAGSSGFCVFTSAAFQDGRGLSVVTTPTAAAHSVELLAALESGPDPLLVRDDNHDEPWEVRDLPGRGKGVVATRRIARGQVVMVDYAAVLAEGDFPSRAGRAEGNQLLQRAMDQLPDPQRVLSLARSSTKGAPVPEDVMRTNTFATEVAGRTLMALFPRISRINHACKPAAYARLSKETLGKRVVAFRDIEAGEEITISYIEAGKPFAERQKSLKSRWGFECRCSLCSAAEGERAESDRRRKRVQRIRDEVLGLVQQRDFAGAIRLNEELVGLMKAEGLAPHLGEYYEVLARLYLSAADLGSAQRFAQLAVEEMEANGGAQAFVGMKELQTILGWQST